MRVVGTSQDVQKKLNQIHEPFLVVRATVILPPIMSHESQEAGKQNPDPLEETKPESASLGD